ncbi:MAG: cell division protein SepF [Lactobacillus sp.]|nr:cell division protein SepF [Lactobacillus sp.]MDN6052407.1 cell division protein SepF [Lactobacillus sp.]
MLSEKFNHFFGLNDENDGSAYEDQFDEATDETANSLGNSLNRDNVVPIKQGLNAAKSQIILYEPRVYSDAKDVAQNLLANKAVIINFGRMEDESARRVVDFVTGTVYALGGKIQRIGDKIFLATPPKFSTDGKISELLDKKDGLS